MIIYVTHVIEYVRRNGFYKAVRNHLYLHCVLLGCNITNILAFMYILMQCVTGLQLNKNYSMYVYMNAVCCKVVT